MASLQGQQGTDPLLAFAAPGSPVLGDRLQAFEIGEIEGTYPISLRMMGGLMIETGAEFGTTLRGGKHLPFGGSRALLSATGLELEDTEMTVAWDASYILDRDMVANGIDVDPTPEGMLAAFRAIQKRARLCNVTVGSFAAIGLLRGVTPTPTRGYNQSISGSTGQLRPAGTNLAVKLKWEWSSFGIPNVAPDQPPSGADIAGGLSTFDTNLSAALTDDAFSPDLGTALGDGLGKIRSATSGLRKATSSTTRILCKLLFDVSATVTLSLSAVIS